MFRYHVENGTEMKLTYLCQGPTLDPFDGIIPPSSATQRRLHGINPSFTMYTDCPEVHVTLKAAENPRQPSKTLVLLSTGVNHVTVQCGSPFQGECYPSEFIVSGKHLA